MNDVRDMRKVGIGEISVNYITKNDDKWQMINWSDDYDGCDRNQMMNKATTVGAIMFPKKEKKKKRFRI